MYLEYADYQNMGGDENMEESAFYRLEMRARKLIDRATHDRLLDEYPMRECVRLLMFDLIGEMRQMDASRGQVAQSMSNDGVSITYAAAKNGAYERSMQLIGEYLFGETTASGVPLLYAGVDA